MRFLFVLFFLVSCGSLTSIDKPVCVEISIDKGYCTTIISGEGFYVDEDHLLEGDTWFSAKPKMILVPATTWAAIKKYLIVNCKRSKSCNANIDSWTRSMETIDSQVEQKSLVEPEHDGNSDR